MNYGLFFRLSLSLILLFLVTTSFMAYVLINEAKETVNESKLQQAHTLAKGLAEGSLDALAVKDYELLERWLKAATPIDDFAYAYLTNKDGVIISHTTLEQVARKTTPLGAIKAPLVRDISYMNRPVKEVVYAAYLGNKHMANAHLGYFLDTKPFKTEHIVNRVIGLLVITLLILSLATFFILRWVLKPIETLAGVMKKTTNYLPDLSDKLLQRRDEVGLLSRNFDSLMQRLSRSYKNIHHQATHDSLTGLVNRYEFEARLKNTLTLAHSNGTESVFCYLDLDHFKIINDTEGHVAGDTMLKEFSIRLNQLDSLQENATLARLGGDEFGLLLENYSLDDAYKITESILQTIDSFVFNWQDKSFSVSCSIGVVPVNADSQSSTQLFADADVACYTAKERGRHCVYFYDESSQGDSSHSQDVSRATLLKRAMQEDRLLLYAQPIADLSLIDNGCNHFELLLRMLDENNEVVSVGDLIAATERFGLMLDIDRWVIDNAFKQIQKFITTIPDALLSINLSGNSLSDVGLSDYVINKAKEFSINPSCICFEITETVAINNLQQASVFIRHCRQHGCKFSLDDFGSGLSSFTYLKELEVDYLKIDGAFVQDMLDNPIDHAMVAAINQVGHIMNIKTIAEFASSNHIVKRLKQMGVDYAQGYAVGKPMPVMDLLRKESDSA